MGPGHAQTGPKSQKTLEGHISLKTCSDLAFEVFFRFQNSCGRAQTGPGRVQTGPKSQKTLEGYISLMTCPN